MCYNSLVYYVRECRTHIRNPVLLMDSDSARLNDPKFARGRVYCRSIDQSLNENQYSGEEIIGTS
jgi:hypothetical protein